MNLVGLLEPLVGLAPSPMAIGLSSCIPGVGDLRVKQLVPGIRGAVEGVAGDAMARKLGIAADDVLAAVGAGDALDRIADRGAHAVNRAIADITTIAHDCLREVVQQLVATASAPGPAALLGGAGTIPIVEKHKLEAQQRLGLLGRELGELTSEISTVEVPGAPSVESGPRHEAAAPTAPAVSPTTGEAGAGDQPVASEHDVVGAPSPQAAAAVSAAKTALGTPYQWGGNVPGVGLDCSGLTQWAYGQAGVEIPRTADAQAVGAQVSMEQLAPGDLVVWDGHVAMAIGDGQMIEAGDPVQINPVRTDNIGMNFLGFYRPTA